MERQLARDDLGAEQRVQFSFALAKAREDRGEYARAFELYDDGNRARRALEHYDPVQTEVINDRIRTVFTTEFLAATPGRAIRTRRRSSSSACRAPARRWSSRSSRATRPWMRRTNCRRSGA